MACNPIELFSDPGKCTQDAISELLGGALEDMAAAVMEGLGKAVASLGTMWVNVGTPILTFSEGDSSSVQAGDAGAGSGFLTLVMGYVFWIGLVVAVLSLFALGALIAVKQRRGEGFASLGKLGLILGAVVLMGGASSIVAGLLPNGPTNAGGAVMFLQSALWYYTGAFAVLSVILGGIRMVWEQRAEPGKDTVRSLLTLVVVAGAGVTITALLVAAADGFSAWIIDKSLDCSVVEDGACFGRSVTTLLAFGGGSGLGAILIILLGLIAIFASITQIILMIARGGMLVILSGILPLAASITNTESGKTWFKKCIAWLAAFILYKPAAAIIYATAFYLTGSDVFKDDGTGLLSILTGMILMVLALFAMPALMRFVTPMVGAMAAGGAGMGAAAMAGGAAALPTGAAQLGRLAGSKGEDGAQGATGSSSMSTGATQSAPQQSPGSQGAGTAAAKSGGGAATTGGGAGGGAAAAGGGAAAAGGGAAAGGAAAGGAAAGGGVAAGASAGAAGGPWGAAAGAALGAAKQAGQAASGAAKDLGEQATAEGSGS
ncbi:MAG: hypothetical protein D3X82_17660 [Candidatus Leucobacter sulfamidivorax]|nr:hypothetical protein [Candidatus Leucobacter sulfamidivorax]